MEIWHQSRNNASYENRLSDYFLFTFKEAVFNNNNPPLDPDLLKIAIQKTDLIRSLEKDHKLPPTRSNLSIEILSNIQTNEFFISTEIQRISFDFMVVHKNSRYYFEVHEKQHCNLSVSRRSNIYDDNGTPIEVPRYLQRLIRDCWRLQCAKYFKMNYSILWFDYINIHCIPDPIIEPGIKEYSVTDKFSLYKFWV